MNYYYLAASLPTLSMSSKPSISSEDFRAIAAENLSRSDIKALEELDAMWETEPEHPFVRSWKAKEISIRNSLARLRASELNKDAKPFLREPDHYDSDSELYVHEAVIRENPLESEQLLDRCRWNALDSMSNLSEFSGNAILSYSIKLRIAERWARMDAAAGSEAADSVVSNAQQKAARNESGQNLLEIK